MPVRQLPNDPNLDHLKGQAKALLAALQSHDPAALERQVHRGQRPAAAFVRETHILQFEHHAGVHPSDSA